MPTILDHGYLNYVEHYGSDESVIEAARMSTGKGFLGWEAGVCPSCDGNGGNEPDAMNTWTCRDCDGKGTIPGDLGLLRRLWVKKHATPFEMAGMIVEAQAPIMVFREWHRHRTQSYNEMSARYTPLPDVNYVPSVERLLVSSDGKNRQAGTVKDAGVLTDADAHEYRDELRQMWRLQQDFYEKWLKRGVPKELARSHIGVGRYSKMRAAANLRNWLGFLALRMAGDAQYEIRMYATALCGMLQERFPRTLALFLEGK